MRQPSVILLSGGLDSTANLAFACEYDEPVLALTIRYGQRAAEREVIAARGLCEYYGVEHQVMDLSWLGALGGSSLTQSSMSVPELKTSELDDLSVIQDTAKSVWVPNRNGVFINVAAAWAERRGAKRVVVGFNREEATTFPDNSIDFLNRSTRSLELSTANHVEVFCYTAAWDKREIVRELEKLSKPFPFEKVWSCYMGGETACGKCESCQRLSRALSVRTGNKGA
ncbi:MAG: 7-cyano-7-deazaguanine synthase QueC [Bdellovibrionia bacterium]